MPVFEPLREPAFRRLATSYAFNELGWGFGTVALAILVYDRTDSALATTLLFLATTCLPALAAPALTARLDRLAVRRALPGLYLTEAALFAALMVVTDHFSLPAVLALAIADGAIAIAGRALTRAAVAAALNPSDSLDAGNRLLNVLFSISFATGPAIAAAVVAGAGVTASLGVTAGLFVLMAAVLGTSRALPPARGDADRSWRERLREGIGHARENDTVRRVLKAHAAALCFAAAVTPIEVVYAERSLGAGSAAYGLLLAAWGGGTVISSFGLARVKRRSGLLRIPLAAAGIGLGFLVMAAAPSLPIALTGCVLGGMGNGIYYVSVVQALQDRIAADFQARVMSLLESTTAASYGVGFLLGGLLTALADPRVAIAVAGTGVVISAAAISALLGSGRRAARAQPAGLTRAPGPVG